MRRAEGPRAIEHPGPRRHPWCVGRGESGTAISAAERQRSRMAGVIRDEPRGPVLVAAAAGALGVVALARPGVAAVRAGQRAEDFELKDLSGRAVRLSGL